MTPKNGFLEIALRNAARGYRVHPLRGKDAFLKDWPNVATTDEETIREWAVKFPDYNCGIAAGPDITIVDSDRVSRLKELSGEHAVEWFNTYSVSSGRPDRAHFYYRMTDEVRAFGNKRWAEVGIDGNVFELKVHGGQVVAEGSIHPDTGQVYRITQDVPLIPFPAGLMALIRECYAKTNPTGKREWNLPVHDGEGRDDFLIQQAGKLRNAGASEAIIRAHLAELNEDPTVMADPKSEADLDRIARSAARYDVPEPVGEVVFGSTEPKPPVDWRTRYLTFERVRDAKPVEFLIEGFLALDSITAIAAPVGQRKSLIALNVAHALCTGEPLFDYFKVVKRPVRVVYLCPEMGLSSFSMRLKQIGLDSYIGETLFCQTMDDDSVKLTDLDEELPGSVVIIDTLTRFVEGDQNSSEDMSRFAKVIFSLKRRGATILLLHHSIKGTNNGSLTLDSAMRGSTELAAFVTSCWATKLLDLDEPYQSPSRLANVKQRDFESKPFDVKSGTDCRLHIIGEPGQIGEIKKQKDADAEKVLAALLKDSPNMGINKLREALKKAGFPKGAKWVTKKRTELAGTGVTLTSE
jgi:AAA domain/Bifunctional DNA primase/polymerase, N-terminal/Primase C terminal 1 (PriCT-1)